MTKGYDSAALDRLTKRNTASVGVIKGYWNGFGHG